MYNIDICGNSYPLICINEKDIYSPIILQLCVLAVYYGSIVVVTYVQYAPSFLFLVE